MEGGDAGEGGGVGEGGGEVGWWTVGEEGGMRGGSWFRDGRKEGRKEDVERRNHQPTICISLICMSRIFLLLPIRSIRPAAVVIEIQSFFLGGTTGNAGKIG